MRRPSPFRSLLRLGAVLLAATCISCGDDDDSGQGTLIIHMTDAVFPFSFVSSTEVVIDSVAVKMTEDGDEDEGFITVNRTQQIIDLLELRNGVTVTLSDALVPAGALSQARIYTGDATITLTDDREFPLTFPSGSSAGVKIFPSPPIEVPEDETVEVLLDFDLSKSFSAVPAAPTRAEDITSFMFHPVLRVANLVDVGAISGTVFDDLGTPLDPLDDVPLAAATVVITQGSTEIASTSTEPTGEYAVLGLAPGEYTVTASSPLGYTSANRQATVIAANETEDVNLVLNRIP